MTITIWINHEYVIDWRYYKDHLEDIYRVCTKEPGGMDYVQVNITPEDYLKIIKTKT